MNLFGGATRSRTGLHGFAIRCITALLSRRRSPTKKGSQASLLNSGAGEESRTLDLNLGKVALYQLSYSRLEPTFYCLLLPFTTAASFHWSGRRVSNSRPQPWQGCALPTELLPRHQQQASIIEVLQRVSMGFYRPPSSPILTSPARQQWQLKPQTPAKASRAKRV